MVAKICEKKASEGSKYAQNTLKIPQKWHNFDQKNAIKARIDIQMTAKLKSDDTKSKSGHLKASMYLSVAWNVEKIVKKRQKGEIFAKYPTLTLKK